MVISVGSTKLSDDRKLKVIPLPFLTVQTNNFLWSDDLTFLCCIACFKIVMVRIYRDFHWKVALVECSNTIEPLQTQAKLRLPFLVFQVIEFLETDPQTTL